MFGGLGGDLRGAQRDSAASTANGSVAVKAAGQLDQLASPVEWFFSGEQRYGLDIKYGGQRTGGNKLVLTAGNCFWDDGIRAYGAGPLANTSESALIRNDFEYAANLTTEGQTIRWHIWCDKPGRVRAIVHLEVSKEQAGSAVEISLGGKTVLVRSVFNSDKKNFGQPWGVVFDVPKKGKYTFCLRAMKVSGKEIGKLRRVELDGSAIEGALLLRARWRPAAVHGRLWSSRVKDSNIWVVQSKSTKGCSSYSPITTPFGYYGASFGADGRTSTSMNFSMWSYGRGKKEPPIEQLSHLIALGSPDATFGGFGHEGTGVKPRGNWQPLAARPEILTQALRLESGEPYDTYYGYFLDTVSGKWKFFAAGRKWHAPGKGQKHLSSPGSFVEVPGPANRQRSGDVRREVFIRGWVPDADGKWHKMDTASKGSDKNANKTWAFLDGGWYSKAMGGMEHYDHDNVRQLSMTDADEQLPDFLSQVNVKELYKLPAGFAMNSLSTTSQQAELEIKAEDAGTNAKAVVYYGHTDALTFSERWQESMDIGSIKNGISTVKLTGLKPLTEYYCRILITNDQGKMWSVEPVKFKTKR